MTLIQQNNAVASELFVGAPGSEELPLEGVTLDSVVGKVARESAALLATLRKLSDRVSSVSDPFAAPPVPGAPRRLGPYRIEAFVRSGGMGEIHRAVDVRLGRTVALKVLPRHRARDAYRRRQLIEEARLLSAVRHPNVCTLYDIGHSSGVEFLVLEYLDGSTLKEWLAERPLTTVQALAIARQVASALDAVHRAGIVHWDLKPANIMLAGRREDQAPAVKLLDFGLARSIADADQLADATDCTTRTNPNLVQGTWPYMAPEQLGGEEVDPRTDVWALGVVLYEMVCGRRPFREGSPAALTTAILRRNPAPPSEVNPACSRELSAVIERCLDKDKSKRWPSCAELALRLDDRTLARDGQRPSTARRFVRSIAAVASMSALLMLRPPMAEAQQARLGPAATTVEADVDGCSTTASPADRALMEEMLVHGRIGKLRRLAIGVSGSSKAPVSWRGTTHDAHIQTVDTYIQGRSRRANDSDNYRYNVAAYRLDRMLGLGMVPVSVERSVHGKEAAVTWWIDDVEMMELERRKLGRQPTDARSWNRQVYRAAIFHELIANADANQTNQLITRDWRVWLIDFTRAFRIHRKLMRPDGLERLDPELREALERLDRDGLRVEMRGLLDPLQIAGILKRRDLILERFATGSASAAGQ